MGIYQETVLAWMIDIGMRHPTATRLRESYIPKARGQILEIGMGSGLNIPHYAPDTDHLLGVEPSDALRKRAFKHAAKRNVSLDFISRDGAEIPLEDKSIDTVVVTWALCSIPNVETALGEMRRVLKPDGQLVFIEHGLAPDAPVQRWQQRLTPVWKCFTGGCHLDRKPDALIQAAGFEITSLECLYDDAPKLVGFTYKGLARPA